MDPVHGGTSGANGPHRRRRRMLRSAVGVVLLVGIALVAFVWWGNPRLGDGGVEAPGAGMSWADDGVTTTRMVMRGAPVSTAGATFSIRNDGHLPFTVRGVDVADAAGWLTRQQVSFVPGLDAGAAPQQQVRLEPGDRATVLWSLPMACRPGMAEGTSMSIDALRYEVSWMGVDTIRELSLDHPITFVGDNTSQPLPGADCAGG